MLPAPEIEVAPDPSSLMELAAEHFLRIASESIHSRGRFTVVLSSGSTPRQLYALLKDKDMEWQRIHIFWGDERCVPPDHPDSNFLMAVETMLSHVPLPATNIHRIPGELKIQEAAERYEKDLRQFFNDRLPRFDLVLLGLGVDGHTASLFRGSPAIREQVRWVVGVNHRRPPAPVVDRITLTPLVLNAARNVIFLVTGVEKADILKKVLRGPSQPDWLPAQVVEPAQGNVIWLMDRAAAQDILPSSKQ